MDPIMCQNNAVIVLEKIKEHLVIGKLIKDICLLDQNNDQVVFLLSDTNISKDKA